MALWRIYYEDASFEEGDTSLQWRQAPNNGVQVILIFQPIGLLPSEWRLENLPDRASTGYVHRGYDRQYSLWTGVDDYDPLDFGPGSLKNGSEIPLAEYFAIWDQAFADAEAYHDSIVNPPEVPE